MDNIERSIWGIYKKFDKDIYLTKIRTNTEVNFLYKILHALDANSVIDIGCGQGRIGIPLAEKGFTVTGLDFDKNVLQQAKRYAKKKNITNISFSTKKWENYDFSKKNDAAIMIYGTFNMLTNEEIVLLLQKIHNGLTDSGILILDLLNKSYIKVFCGKQVELISKYNVDSTEFKNVYRKRIFSSDETYEQTIYSLEKNDGTIQTYSYQQRIFSLEEIINIAKQGGFGHIDFFGNFEGEDYDNNSQRMILVCRKTIS